MITSSTLKVIGTVLAGGVFSIAVLTEFYSDTQVYSDNTTIKTTVIDFGERPKSLNIIPSYNFEYQNKEIINSTTSISLVGLENLPIADVLAEEITVTADIIDYSLINVTSCRMFCCGSYTVYSTEPIEEIMFEEEESILSEQIITDPFLFEAKAYPNPTRDNSTIELGIELDGNFIIQLFDMNGRLVQQIYDGHLESGRQSFTVDLYDNMPGLYLVSIQSLFQKETLKIQKIE